VTDLVMPAGGSQGTIEPEMGGQVRIGNMPRVVSGPANDYRDRDHRHLEARRHMSRLRLIAIAALALLALPASVLAATADVTGTVTAPEGVSVTGVEVAVLVQGTDQVIATTTDGTGAWTLQVDVEPGAVLEVRATGVQTRSDPDEDGCVMLSTPIGRLEVTIAELPPAAIEVPLDDAITGEICSATATPEATAKPATVTKPDTTPPSTDALGVAGRGGAGPALLIVLGLLAMVSATAIALAGRHRTRQVADRTVHRD
jgi:hypothetical protein